MTAATTKAKKTGSNQATQPAKGRREIPEPAKKTKRLMPKAFQKASEAQREGEGRATAAAEPDSRKPSKRRAAKKKIRSQKEALIAAANESTLRAWKYTYAKRRQFGKFD